MIDKNSMNLGYKCDSLIIKLTYWLVGRLRVGFRESNAQDRPHVSLFLLLVDLDVELSANLQQHLCLHPTMLIMNQTSETISKLQLNAF